MWLYEGRPHSLLRIHQERELNLA
uniref:Uncharacterized protein n=1 Tax=Anguilla anguilla TaxID=7936 RepID=A0A0E9P9T5_ANGAN